jgi:hypothetical protein
MDNYTKQIPGGRAPATPQAGMGQGNRPFAPGLMSGRNLGQQNTNTPLARSSSGPRQLNAGGPARGPSQPPGGRPQGPGGPGGGGPPQQAPPPGTGSVIDPTFYMKLLDEYMRSLFESAKKPLIGGIY